MAVIDLAACRQCRIDNQLEQYELFLAEGLSPDEAALLTGITPQDQP